MFWFLVLYQMLPWISLSVLWYNYRLLGLFQMLLWSSWRSGFDITTDCLYFCGCCCGEAEEVCFGITTDCLYLYLCRCCCGEAEEVGLVQLLIACTCICANAVVEKLKKCALVWVLIVCIITDDVVLNKCALVCLSTDYLYYHRWCCAKEVCFGLSTDCLYYFRCFHGEADKVKCTFHIVV